MIPSIPRLLSLLLLSTLLTFTSARSVPPPPIRRTHIPGRSSIQILPRSQGVSINPLTRARSLLPPITPPPSDLLHSDTLLLTVSLPSALHHEAYLLLRPSELFHPEARQVSGEGQTTFLSPSDWRLYSGEVIAPNWVDRVLRQEAMGQRGGKGRIGTASIMVHRAGDGEVEPLFEGNFRVYGETYHILLREKYDRVKALEDAVAEEMGEMVVFRDSDMAPTAAHPSPKGSHAHSCTHDSLPHNSNTSHPVWTNRHAHQMGLWESIPGGSDIWKRQGDIGGGAEYDTNFIDSIGSTQGCPNTQQIVYMGVALDCTYVSQYGGADNARTQILNVWNQASALYRQTFNISLGIIELQVMNETCSNNPGGQAWNVGCDRSLTLDQRLSLFSQWRGNKGADGAGLWHLMSNCPTDREVGVAWLGTLCQSSASEQGSTVVSGTGVSTASRNEWTLVAHEVGHNFGAIHDCDDGCSLTSACCPFSRTSCDAGSAYIMNPTTAAQEIAFSPCTIGNVCSNLGTRAISTSCIQTPGSRSVISLQQCGNGIVEAGEECDPGSNSSSTCCDPTTCRFRSGAVCDPTNSACCTSSCQFASAGTVCRPRVNDVCDIEETCTGNSSACPADQTQPDGTSCGNDGLACASGTCTSLNQQCQSAGRSMGLQETCGQRGDTSCVVRCRDPRRANQCIILQTPLLDGSPCGYGGHCYNQTCVDGPWQNRFSQLYTQNLQISIPVTVVVGLVILAILFFIIRGIYRCCSGTTRKQAARKGALPPPPMRQSAFANNPPPAPPQHPSRTSQYGSQPGYGQNRQSGYDAHRQSQWVDPMAWNGPNYGYEQAYGTMPQHGQGQGQQTYGRY